MKPLTINPRILEDLRDLYTESNGEIKKPIDELVGKVCTDDAVHYLSQFPDNSVDMIFTDEPYGIESAVITFRDNTRKPITMDFDWDGEFPSHISIPWVLQAHRILKDGGVIINCGVSSWSSSFENVCIDAGLTFRAHIIWIKTVTPPRVRLGGWRSAYEVIWVASKGSLRNRMNPVGQQHILNWEIETVCPRCGASHPVIHSANYNLLDTEYVKAVEDWGDEFLMSPYIKHQERVHQTQKPEWLAAKFIWMLTKPGDIVVDPFMGSGVFLKMAHTMGRRFAGCDKDEQWEKFVTKSISKSQPNFPDIGG